MKEFPNAHLVGFKAPPFVDLQQRNENNIIKNDLIEINKLKPDIIWIGISTVKQDFLMYNHLKYLDQGIMIGVGAVFLYMAGVIKKGPEWVKQLGLRWILRLIQEPKRLWRSTLPSGIFFLYLVLKELFSKKR